MAIFRPERVISTTLWLRSKQEMIHELKLCFDFFFILVLEFTNRFFQHFFHDWSSPEAQNISHMYTRVCVAKAQKLCDLPERALFFFSSWKRRTNWAINGWTRWMRNSTRRIQPTIPQCGEESIANSILYRKLDREREKCVRKPLTWLCFAIKRQLSPAQNVKKFMAIAY